MTTVLLLAAGRSRRFGPDCKLQTLYQDKPLVRYAADAIVETGFPAIAVVSDPAVAALLPEFQVVFSTGPQSQSLQAGLQQIACGPVLIVLGDMPHVDAALLKQVAQSPLPAAVTDSATISPPACLPHELFPVLAALTGDRGAGAFLRSRPDLHRVLVAPTVLTDIDRPDDLR